MGKGRHPGAGPACSHSSQAVLSPRRSPWTSRAAAPTPSAWRPPTRSLTPPTCDEGPSRTWPRCAWLYRMRLSHLPSPRLPTTWQCPRTRLPGPWWARSQPPTWTPRPALSGELECGHGLRRCPPHHVSSRQACYMEAWGTSPRRVWPPPRSGPQPSLWVGGERCFPGAGSRVISCVWVTQHLVLPPVSWSPPGWLSPSQSPAHCTVSKQRAGSRSHPALPRPPLPRRSGVSQGVDVKPSAMVTL